MQVQKQFGTEGLGGKLGPETLLSISPRHFKNRRDTMHFPLPNSQERW